MLNILPFLNKTRTFWWNNNWTKLKIILHQDIIIENCCIDGIFPNLFHLNSILIVFSTMQNVERKITGKYNLNIWACLRADQKDWPFCHQNIFAFVLFAFKLNQSYSIYHSQNAVQRMMPFWLLILFWQTKMHHLERLLFKFRSTSSLHWTIFVLFRVLFVQWSMFP